MNCGAPTVNTAPSVGWEGGHKRSKPVFVGVTDEATEDSGEKTEKDMMKK